MPTTGTEEPAEVIQLRWRPLVGLPERLRMLRKDYGRRIGNPKITQVQFAEVIGANPNTYKQWESGNNKPADLIQFAKDVFEATRCDPAWLLDVAEAPGAGPDDTGGQEIAPTRWYEGRRVRPTRHLAAVSPAA